MRQIINILYGWMEEEIIAGNFDKAYRISKLITKKKKGGLKT